MEMIKVTTLMIKSEKNGEWKKVTGDGKDDCRNKDKDETKERVESKSGSQ